MPGFDGLARHLRPRRAKKKAAKSDAPTVPAPARQKIGLKKKGGGAHGIGEVTELRDADEYEGGDHVHVEVRHGAIPKKKDGSRDHSKPSPATTRLKLPRELAKGLRIGGKVRIHVEPCD